jgi:ubiquinone/menaquinone biosynthesis C-methylase UbiE
MSGIRYSDGTAYEQMIGPWTQQVGEVFLSWLDAPKSRSWLDVGCGNGAFTEIVIERQVPSEVVGIDPSEDQLAFARARPKTRSAIFKQGDAVALPFEASRFDAAVMALVIPFVSDTNKAISEMVRVVRPGGLVASYMWDVPAGGAPNDPIFKAIEASGFKMGLPANIEASRMPVVRQLWQDAGLQDIKTRVITVHRTFDSFDSYWEVNTVTGAAQSTLERMAKPQQSEAKERAMAAIAKDPDGKITLTAVANAVFGRVPA